MSEAMQARRDLLFLDRREYQDPGDKTVNEDTREKRRPNSKRSYC